MRVKDEPSGLFVPMIFENYYMKTDPDVVWVVGVTKDILKEYDIGLVSCSQVHRYLYAYLVNKADLERFLITNNIPMLSFVK